SNIQVLGPGASSLTVRRDTGGDYRIFTIDGGPNILLQGMTIANGSQPSGAGGGINNNGGILTVTNAVITGNSSYYGGGVFNGGTLTLMDSIVRANSASSGGGIDNGTGYGGTLIVDSSTFSDNVAGNDGGAIWNYYSGAVTLKNSTLSRNS